MIDVNNQPDLDDVLSVLTQSVTKSNNTKKSIEKKKKDLSDESIYNFVLEHLTETIESNTDVLTRSAEVVEQTGDAICIDAHSKLLKSQNDLLGSLLNAIQEKKKLEQTDKHKTRDLDLKERALTEKRDPLSLPGGTMNVQNNFMITANREEIFDAMFEKDPDKRKKALEKLEEKNGFSLLNSSEEERIIN